MQVLEIFNEITKIPRPSKHEEQMNAWLRQFAKDHNLICESYPIHEGATTANIIIRVPATSGYEDREGVILQAHQDMVCEKDSGVEHDFMRDPIQTYEKDGWLHANGTTLGADNGIGVAMALAAALSDAPHPALELLFTTDEETGLTGAHCLPDGVLQGKRLINLDNEDDGQICMGCAGGIDTLARLYYTPEKAEAGFAARISVSGLQGGHSGEDINKNRANANKILTRILFGLLKEIPQLRLAQIDGGNLRNAIAREAKAVVIVPMKDKEQLRVQFNVVTSVIEQEIRRFEPDMKIELESCADELFDAVLPAAVAERLLLSLIACPHGVFAMSPDIEGLVQTSTNLASVKMKEDERGNYVEINTSQRSSVESEKHYLKDMVECALRLSGAEVSHGDGYPGWKPNPSSALLQVVKDSWYEVTGKDAQVVAIHAGLECGLFLEKYSHLDMVAFGPQMRDVHSPAERLNLASTERTYRWLLKTLEKL